MKKLEYILYAVTLIIGLVAVMAKVVLWSWAGVFLINSYTALAFLFTGLSWLVYSTRNERNERVYFLYGTIPLGLSLAILLFATIAKLQCWPWEGGAFRVAIFSLIIVEIIFVTAFLLIEDALRKEFLKKIIFKTLGFLGLTLLVSFADFGRLLERLSTPEANKRRELWRLEAERQDSLDQITLPANSMPTQQEKEVIFLVGNSRVYLEKEKSIENLSSGKEGLAMVATLADTSKGIWLVRVHNTENSMMTYFNFLVDANKDEILNPTGELNTD